MGSIVTSQDRTSLEYDAMFLAEWPGVVRYLRGAVGDDDLAQDLAQETFFRASQALAAFRGECSPRTWLRRIAANVLRNHWRARGSERRAGHGAWPDDDDIHLADPLESPALDLERREVRACLGDLMARLPSGEREVLYLAIEGAMPPREIAQSLHLTPEATRARLHRARRKMAALVAHRCTLVTDEGGALSCEARRLLASGTV